VCTGGAQYQTRAGGANSDRECADLTACDDDQYISKAPTATSDRACTALTICVADDEYETKEAEESNDRECADLTTCRDGEWTSVVHTEFADRTCTAHTVCENEEYQTKAAGIINDRECTALTACNSNQWINRVHTVSTDRSCKDHTVCTVGAEFQTLAGGSNFDRECSPVKVCLFGEYISTAPTATADLVCTNHTVCTHLEFQSKAGGVLNNRVCTALTVCDDDLQWESKAAAETTDRECTVSTVCSAIEWVSTASTTTSDRVCTAATVCTEKQFESAAVTSTSDRECQTTLVCISGKQFETEKATDTTNRECQDYTVCGEDYNESAQPTATSDRECVQVDDCFGTNTCLYGVCVDKVRKFDCTCFNDTITGSNCDCTDGRFSVKGQAGVSPCVPIHNCYDGYFEIVSPTPTSDRSCKKGTECTDNEWMVSDVTALKDRVCKAFSECSEDDDLEEAEAPTATTDRVCRPIDDCIKGGDQCKQESTCVDKHPKIGMRCVCVEETGFSGARCDCLEGYSYAIHPVIFQSPCLPIGPACDDDEWQVQAPSKHSDRRCRDLTVCADDYFESAAPTTTTDRVCIEHAAECGGKFGTIEVQAPTAFQNRICTNTTSTTTISTTTTITATTVTTATTTTGDTVYPCEKECFNGGECVLVQSTCGDSSSPYDTPVCQCPAADKGVCFWGSTCQQKESGCGSDTQSCNRVDTVGRRQQAADLVCSDAVEPDGICSKALASAANADSPSSDIDASAASSMVGAGLVAVVLAAILVALFVKKSRSESAEQPDEMEVGTINPAIWSKEAVPESDIGELSNSAVGKLAPFAMGALPLAALSQRGDRLWMDFRRCASFDSTYYGNPVLKLADRALRDVYAVLQIPCPPVAYFQPLRAVGDQFLSQVVGREGHALTDVDVIEDTADFVTAAMADVLVERAIDLCATVANAGVEYNDAAIYEAFYAMVDKYDPKNNHFLSESPYEEIRGLRHDACDRTPNVKDAIYWEVDDVSSSKPEYASVADFGLGRGTSLRNPSYNAAQARRQQENAYDFGSNEDEAVGEALYAMAEGAGLQAESNDYAMATAEGDEPMYGTANHIDRHGPIYDQSTTDTEPTYAVGAANDVEDEPTYALGTTDYEPTYDVVAPSHLAIVAGASPAFKMQSMAQRNAIGSEPVYAFGQAIGEPQYAVGSAMEAAVNPGFGNQDYESLYTTASNEDDVTREEYEADAYATGDRAMSQYHTASASGRLADVVPRQPAVRTGGMMEPSRRLLEEASNAELVYDTGATPRSSSYTEAQEQAQEQASAASLLATRQAIKRASYSDATLSKTATHETLQSLAELEDDPDYQEFAAMFEPCAAPEDMRNHALGRSVNDEEAV
jgi:hypothetical protein